MPLIIGVHGIAQQQKGAPELLETWWPSLKSGVSNAKRSIADGALACAFYGGLFRGGETLRSAGEPELLPSQVTDPFDLELLTKLWAGAAASEPLRVVAPDAANLRMVVPKSVQSALQALSRSRFFARIGESAMIGNLRQVRLYMRDPIIRAAAQDAVDEWVTADTRVLVAHSLGSVVAYESLHRFAGKPNWANVRTLVTLGSPLGISNLIFDSLVPPPTHGKGRWPPQIERWTNISDDYDVVALVKKLGDVFDGHITDIGIDNGATAHDVKPYLTAAATGRAITDGLV
jgi:hypothetical protein